MNDITYVEASRLALASEMHRNDAVWALGQDIHTGGVFGQYKGLVQEFGPARIVDTPIAEATMVGAALGASLVGTRPVVETRFSDFALAAMDELVNQAAKLRYMFGGQGRARLVLRMPAGLVNNSAAQHSQSLEAWFAHIPGLVVTAPATPTDAKGLMLAALRAEDPVVHMEDKGLWNVTGPVPDGDEATPFGVAKIERAGMDITIVSWSVAVHQALAAADSLEADGISAEVINLRTIWPWDRDMVLGSVAKTGHLVIAHQSVRDVGFGAEIAATVGEELHGLLQAPIRRVASPRIPVGYSPVLEDVYRVTADKITAVVKDLVGIHPQQKPSLVSSGFPAVGR